MGKDKRSTVTTTADPASQAAIDRQRQQAATAADVATGAPGNFFLGADPRSVEEIISQFQNPFQSQVVGATQREFQTARERAVGGPGGVNQAATASGAFGGSRQGVAEGVRLGELDRAEQSQLANIRSQGFQQAVSAGIPFAQQQRALQQQQAQEPLFRQEQALRFLNMGLGPTGTTTETVQPGSLTGDIVGAGLTIGGGLLGGPAGAAIGSKIRGPGDLKAQAPRSMQFTQNPFQFQGAGTIDPALLRRF